MKNRSFGMNQFELKFGTTSYQENLVSSGDFRREDSEENPWGN